MAGHHSVASSLPLTPPSEAYNNGDKVDCASQWGQWEGDQDDMDFFSEVEEVMHQQPQLGTVP